MALRRFFLALSALLFAACVWTDPEASPSYLPLDDSLYPFAGLPRLVIESEGFEDVRNTEDELGARLQVYGDSSPLTDVLELELRGRGNSSFSGMPKYGFALKFADKVPLLGMTANRKWTLLPEYSDKTHVRNRISFALSRMLGAPYRPDSRYVEVYLNRSYRGVYLLTEKVEVSATRVDIPKTECSYLVEVDGKYRADEQVIFAELPFRVHFPDDASEESLYRLKCHLDSLNAYLAAGDYSSMPPGDWFDEEAYFRFYWISEFSKNPDANFYTSVFFTWLLGDKIRMGPVWDFDLAYGGYAGFQEPSGWHVRGGGWNRSLFLDENFKRRANAYWSMHRGEFLSILDSVDVLSATIAPALENEFRRWPVLDRTFGAFLVESYDSYPEAVDSLKSWIRQRASWIDAHL